IGKMLSLPCSLGRGVECFHSYGCVAMACEGYERCLATRWVRFKPSWFLENDDDITCAGLKGRSKRITCVCGIPKEGVDLGFDLAGIGGIDAFHDDIHRSYNAGSVLNCSLVALAFCFASALALSLPDSLERLARPLVSVPAS